ncbi:MAG: aminotransferase class I/II-fold pyridoxal phosphate-dependent enzyme [Spirulina sp. SIO3F2]|nr:aminotransferase class I/II-fold pyridoxal phosphate-dependent enzyme [Spirulina sp. SIO3F2]
MSTSASNISASNRVQALSFNAIFSKMNALAKVHQAVNLGHGFPDYPAPDFVKAAARQAIADDRNQYTAAQGELPLRTAIAARMQRRYQVDYNPETEVIVTQGATEAIFATLMGFVNPGDEVILFEPCYSTYKPAIQMVGGIPKFYSFLPPEWELDSERLEALFSEKTKVILVNTPHNPTGKVLSETDLALIARLCQKYNVVAISDEVYDELVYDDAVHRPLCTYPGMYERTITVSTFGKTFSVTGWKVGWAIAPAALANPILRMRLYTSGSGTTPVQVAAAEALSAPPQFYQELRTEYTALRDTCYQMLKETGFKPFLPAGTFFLMADFSGFLAAQNLSMNDIDFCQYLTQTVGVTAIPASTLYHDYLPPDYPMVRFAFCKHRATLLAAQQRLRQALEPLTSG